MSNQKITLVAQPEGFFFELLMDAMRNQNLKTSEETKAYLVSLLGQFMTTDRLFSRDEKGNYREDPIATMLFEAIEEPQAEIKKLMFRNVGDICLYKAGFFQDSIHRKLVDVDYYVGMGGKAYLEVARRVEEKNMQSVFGDLSEKFSSYVDVLAEVSDKTFIRTEKDLLDTYERWERTDSFRALKALQGAGITPLKKKNNGSNGNGSTPPKH